MVNIELKLLTRTTIIPQKADVKRPQKQSSNQKNKITKDTSEEISLVTIKECEHCFPQHSVVFFVVNSIFVVLLLS